MLWMMNFTIDITRWLVNVNNYLSGNDKIFSQVNKKKEKDKDKAG